MLKGEHIFLGPVARTDSEMLFGWINDPHTVRYNAPYTPVHEQIHAQWMEKAIQSSDQVIFAIRRNVDDGLVGVVQLVDIHPVHRSAQLVIRIGSKTERGKGFGTEAVRLIIDFAFRDRNLHRVWLVVFADNERAIAAYEKAGLRKEGRLLEAFHIDGGWRDGVLMSLLSGTENATRL